MTWSKTQRNVVIAAFLGWTLDAFDFFLMVFMFTDISRDLHANDQLVSGAVFVTLAMRPVGAFLFGRLADRWGRKPALMWDVLAYSLLEAASGLAPTMSSLLLVRALFGIAMGGEWGIGAALTMETIPPEARGAVSGLLQIGYPAGYLLAAIANYALYDSLGWRGMFLLGVLPGLLAFFIRRGVGESPAWSAGRTGAATSGFLPVLAVHWRLALYAIALMTAFNFFSHGSQDAYPSYFLKREHHFDTHLTSLLTAISMIGAICGGLAFGTLSQRLGRRRAILLGALLSLPAIPLWAFGTTPLTLGIGAFLMQVAVQGAWGVIPAHLNELSPAEIRATFPGLVYQLGNLLAAANLNLQLWIAAAHGVGVALALVVGITALVIAVLVGLGPERRGITMSIGAAAPGTGAPGSAVPGDDPAPLARLAGRVGSPSE